MDQEKMFYNAVAIALDGNPQGVRMVLRKLKKQNDGVFPGWAAAYEYLAGGGMKVRNPDTMPDPDLEWENIEQRGIRLIFQNETEYPPLLRTIHHPPLALYILGTLPQTPSITIVGTRHATPDGKVIARRFARDLAYAGFTIISGLALGIDAEAHAGCLEAGDSADGASGIGKTVAVLARGSDKFYPRENERLGLRILENGGAVISEYPPAEPPYPDRFLERNRIVSGLSCGVLVVEAPQRSGSLATATYALEQNRDLFVVPGPITHSNFFGSHQLIRQGAELVTTPEEILESYNMLKKQKLSRATLAKSTEEKHVLLALDAAATALEVDKIIELTKLEPRVVNQTLSFLVLKHLVKETEAGYIIE